MSGAVSKISVDTPPIMLTNQWNIGLQHGLSSGCPFFPAVGRRLGTGESHISRGYISLTESFIVPRVQRQSLAPLIIPRNIACVP